jgi:alpha-glucosidase
MEADLFSYPGMFVVGGSEGERILRGKFSPYPKKEAALKRSYADERDFAVIEAEEFIAKTSGKRSYPWRVLVITDDDRHLVENETVFKLARPLAIKDTSWIKPGLVAWDWWNANNITGVPFKAGINTETYKAYIDFASDYAIPYIILDEGWSRTTGNIVETSPDIDLPELVRYSRAKGVGLVLWVLSNPLNNRMEEALDLYSRWGVKGIKVDFMQRDDQKMVDFYWRLAERAAEHRLLVDFHGAYKPAGLRRAYPNVLTREGLCGLEHNKWSRDETPHQDLILPFVRMVPGPMDYTPGAMANAQAKDFAPIFDVPMSQGTRAHQLAMYAVYESPLQMLADSPSRYRKEDECVAFISRMPVVWHETRVLAGKVGEYIAVARRHGDSWYVGAMADEPVSLEVTLDFLDKTYRAVIFRDGPNAERNGVDYEREEKILHPDNSVRIVMARGGGWIARLDPSE